ncbi:MULTISPECIES: hypothetical protein [Bacillaceae]|uniref:Uncharacterized protein n=1 Tax=Evansella alkalicola TaxID=745819 RepID=A0ABS6JP46_9BACI|nr:MULTISPECIES: hypothetical protein [Bacillaceae]MBU9719866.1 hypothetical protein [Bacillus alkalicola]
MNDLQIFIEYKISADMVHEYENHMQKVLDELRAFGAADVEWFEAADQENLYVEMFLLPTMESYELIKGKRRDGADPVFGQLDKYIVGGLQKLHCWAFVQRGSNR